MTATLRGRSDAVAATAPLLVAGSVAVHTLAAAGAFALLLGPLSESLDVPSSPEITAMARGLKALLAAILFLPPVAPLLLVGAVGLIAWRGRDREASKWASVSLVPYAVERIGTLALVVIAPRPATPPDVIMMADIFSLGPRLLMPLAGWNPSPFGFYVSGALSVTALVTVYCCARSVAVATRRRGSPEPDSIDWLRAFVSVSVAYLALSATVGILSPLAVRVFLALAG